MMELAGFVVFLMLLICSLTISHMNPVYLEPTKLMHTLDMLQRTCFPLYSPSFVCLSSVTFSVQVVLHRKWGLFLH